MMHNFQVLKEVKQNQETYKPSGDDFQKHHNLVETNYYLASPNEDQDYSRLNLDDIQDSEVVFVLNLDIGSGKKDKIIFKSNDTPEDLALKFCRKNNLNIRVYDFVANALREKYDEVTLMKYIRKVNDEDEEAVGQNNTHSKMTESIYNADIKKQLQKNSNNANQINPQLNSNKFNISSEDVVGNIYQPSLNVSMLSQQSQLKKSDQYQTSQNSHYQYRSKQSNTSQPTSQERRQKHPKSSHELQISLIEQNYRNMEDVYEDLKTKSSKKLLRRPSVQSHNEDSYHLKDSSQNSINQFNYNMDPNNFQINPNSINLSKNQKNTFVRNQIEDQTQKPIYEHNHFVEHIDGNMKR